MTPSNELRSLRDETDLESIEQRLSDLESKVEDIEAILMAALPHPCRRSGSIVLWFRRLAQTSQDLRGKKEL